MGKQTTNHAKTRHNERSTHESGKQNAASAGKPFMQLQKQMGNQALVQMVQQHKPNNTGLPDNVKAGIEHLSGMNMDHVKVHYNSAKPAAMHAHAYAQGSDIHVAPGQEKHLPHEAWHTVQQQQGRVKPTTQLNGEAVNDDPALEKEADVMGQKALQAVQKKTLDES
ncbi:eCIS core domain-containing protein [Marinicrinis sediminis]|uniref:DUF4157 domain-containing protein n=1 Tax=Marinicrinis sediminis TaxID=1652465 RepID=A0ABW5RD77_9BACL